MVFFTSCFFFATCITYTLMLFAFFYCYELQKKKMILCELRVRLIREWEKEIKSWFVISQRGWKVFDCILENTIQKNVYFVKVLFQKCFFAKLFPNEHRSAEQTKTLTVWISIRDDWYCCTNTMALCVML